MDIVIRKKLCSGLLSVAFGTAILTMLPDHIKAKVSRFTAAIGPDYLPRLVCWILIVCGVLMLLDSFRKEEKVMISLRDEARAVLYMALMLGYIAAISRAGFLLSSLVAVSGSLFFMEERRLRQYLWGIALVLVVWGSFTRLLGVPLP